MQVTLYKHVDGLRFDDPAAIILFNDKSIYAQNYELYIYPARFWTGEGKTFNIELLEVCEIPTSALDNGDPVYIQVVEAGISKYYYVNNIERLPQKVRLYITLDVFATYYHRANFRRITVNKSTYKLQENRLLAIPEEITPIPKNQLTKDVALPISDNKLVFILKIKFLSAKSITNEAYTTRIIAIPVGQPESGGTTWLQHIGNLYTKIINIYEVISNTAGIGLACEVQEIYLFPYAWFFYRTDTNYKFRYVNSATAKSEELQFYFVNQTLPGNSLNIRNPATANIKLIIGNNEIQLPAYLGNTVAYITPVYNLSDIDIIFNYQNNEPQSIKSYFQCEVANSTNETSLQKIARWAGYFLGLRNAGESAAVGAATSAATGNPLGLVAGAMQIKGATDSITAGVIAKATREALPATRFESNGFSVYLDTYTRNLKEGVIFVEYSTTPAQGWLNLELYGVDWFNNVTSLEGLAALPKIITTARGYFEADVEVTGLTLADAQELTQLLGGGVELVKV